MTMAEENDTGLYIKINPALKLRIQQIALLKGTNMKKLIEDVLKEKFPEKK